MKCWSDLSGNQRALAVQVNLAKVLFMTTADQVPELDKEHFVNNYLATAGFKFNNRLEAIPC